LAAANLRAGSDESTRVTSGLCRAVPLRSAAAPASSFTILDGQLHDEQQIDDRYVFPAC
jgi:hypothetical protein